MDEVSGVAFEGRNNVLDGTLEQSNDVGNNLVLALDSAESIELVSTYIEAFLSISCLNGRNGVVLVGNLLNQLGGNISGVAEHHSSHALQAAIEGREIYLLSIESLHKKIVLYDNHLDFLLETLATERTGLLRVETRYIYNIEVSVFLNLFTELLDDNGFIFLSHDVLLNYASSTVLGSTLIPRLIVEER